MSFKLQWLTLFLLLCIPVFSACSHPIHNIAVPPPKRYYAIPLKPQPLPEPIAKPDIPFKNKRKGGLIVLDAGHGGRDLGAHSAGVVKYEEKLLTLSTTRILKRYLEQLGYKVAMTRTEDVYIALDERAAFANNKKPKLFVSMHYNSAPNKEAEGIEIFYYRSDSSDKGRAASSKELAKSILNRVLETTEAKSRGVKHKDLAVIRETNMPAVLIEGGFLTNANEVSKIKDAEYLKKLAWGMAQGIDDYIARDGKDGKEG